MVLMDVRMPAMDGIEATRRICAARPETRVLIVTTFDLDEYVHGALQAGAAGFLLKDTPPADLLRGIGVVAAGESLLAPTVTRRPPPGAGDESFIPSARPGTPLPSPLGTAADLRRPVVHDGRRGVARPAVSGAGAGGSFRDPGAVLESAAFGKRLPGVGRCASERSSLAPASWPAPSRRCRPRTPPPPGTRPNPHRRSAPAPSSPTGPATPAAASATAPTPPAPTPSSP
ncbi:response regulator [Nonomuraea harbinensis]|uniref:Response regulator n=1 Tax=Nonomuraea harbinensis TaxID=1286938 RepID=A0ABW1C5S0_9ACTN